MNSVLRGPMFELAVARWDCGPGCGTTGCGNDPESLRRYQEYRNAVTSPSGSGGYQEYTDDYGSTRYRKVSKNPLIRLWRAIFG